MFVKAAAPSFFKKFPLQAVYAPHQPVCLAIHNALRYIRGQSENLQQILKGILNPISESLLEFMGITIVQKSPLRTSRTSPRIALVLAGGGVTGAAFKLGGLQALSDCLVNRKMTEFDIYMGVSAGSIIATFLANGVALKTLIRSLTGLPGPLEPLRPWYVYCPNFEEYAKAPWRFIAGTAVRTSRTIGSFLASNNIFRKEFRQRALELIKNHDYPSLERFIAHALPHHRTNGQNFIPSGLCSTQPMEKFVRRNLEKQGFANDFRQLYRTTGKALYISAMKLDTAELEVFGHDQVSTEPISKALEASIAIPLFYRPVTINGTEYVDGGIVKTTNMDLAIKKKADLIICYNPFRPFNSEMFNSKHRKERQRPRIAGDGLYAVLSQVIRSLLHTRLMHGINKYRNDPNFKGDIVLIEPTEYDDKIFEMNPMSFWDRQRAAQRGYASVQTSIRDNYDALKPIFTANGIELSLEQDPSLMPKALTR